MRKASCTQSFDSGPIFTEMLVGGSSLCGLPFFHVLQGGSGCKRALNLLGPKAVIPSQESDDDATMASMEWPPAEEEAVQQDCRGGKKKP